MDYQPILGSSTIESFGRGSRFQIDATIADVYLVSEYRREWIIRRPNHLHRKYKGQDMPAPYQIVWLKMDCPHDGSIRGLCLNILLAVDSLVGIRYYKKNATKNPDELLPLMAQAAAVHCLGVLIIDEIQNPQEAKDD